MSHFHNRARVFECLAAILGDRRDRYAIARSLLGKTGQFSTPCLKERKHFPDGPWMRHPKVSLCPRSDEGNGPVNLPVPDDAIWDGLAPFQRFLWYADEMEHRWHALRAAHEGTPTSPRFLEMTWSSAEEFIAGADMLRTTLGCKVTRVNNVKHHVSHTKNSLACAADVQQDLEYRRLMGYNASTLRLLVSSCFPVHINSQECVESPQEMARLTQAHAVEQGIPFVEEEWVFSKVTETSEERKTETSEERKASKGSKRSKGRRRRRQRSISG